MENYYESLAAIELEEQELKAKFVKHLSKVNRKYRDLHIVLSEKEQEEVIEIKKSYAAERVEIYKRRDKLRAMRKQKESRKSTEEGQDESAYVKS